MSTTFVFQCFEVIPNFPTFSCPVGYSLNDGNSFTVGLRDINFVTINQKATAACCERIITENCDDSEYYNCDPPDDRRNLRFRKLQAGEYVFQTGFECFGDPCRYNECCVFEEDNLNTCQENGFDENTCADGADFFLPNAVGNTGDECCVCGISDCTVGCDPGWVCEKLII